MTHPWESLAKQFDHDANEKDGSYFPTLDNTINEAAPALWEVLRQELPAFADCPEYLRQEPAGIGGSDHEGNPVEGYNWGAYWLLALQWLCSRPAASLPNYLLFDFMDLHFLGSWDWQRISLSGFCGTDPERKATVRRRIARLSASACRYIRELASVSTDVPGGGGVARAGGSDIPNLSKPVPKKVAAEAWGVSIKELTARMKEGKIRYKKLSRQSYQFSCDDIPKLPKVGD